MRLVAGSILLALNAFAAGLAGLIAFALAGYSEYGSDNGDALGYVLAVLLVVFFALSLVAWVFVVALGRWGVGAMIFAAHFTVGVAILAFLYAWIEAGGPVPLFLWFVIEAIGVIGLFVAISTA